MAISHAVVLAGGLGTRIRDALGDTPKALADLDGEPLILWKLRELRRARVSEATLLTGHGSDPIRDWCATAHVDLPSVTLCDDGPVLLGTGGALLAALPDLPPEFYLTYGDTLLEEEYALLDRARARASTPCALMVTARVGAADRVNTAIGDGLVRVHHKRGGDASLTHLDYGVMLLTRATLTATATSLGSPTGPLDLSVLLERLAEAGVLAAAVTALPYHEIGSASTLTATRQWASGQPRQLPPPR